MTRPGSPRILVTNWFWRSLQQEGAGNLLLSLGTAMRDAGWCVSLLFPDGDYPPQQDIEIITYRRGVRGLAGYLAAVRRCSAKADAVLLFENNPNMAFVARMSQRPDSTLCYFFTPLQGLQSLADSGMNAQSLVHATAKNPVWSRLQRWRSLRCIVQTQFQAEQLHQLGPAEVHVVPGCSFARANVMPDRASARRTLAWDDSTVVGYLGHYSRLKGVDSLVRAMSQLPHGILALAHSGKGRLKAETETELQKLRQAGRVRELGITDRATFLAACDVVALPYVTSSIHHIPQVLLESLAAATPVITTDVGGIRDVLDAGPVGWLVPARDGRALRAAIEEAVAGPPVCHDRGVTGRRLFESSWCMEAFSARLMELVAEVLPVSTDNRLDL